MKYDQLHFTMVGFPPPFRHHFLPYSSRDKRGWREASSSAITRKGATQGNEFFFCCWAPSKKVWLLSETHNFMWSLAQKNNIPRRIRVDNSVPRDWIDIWTDKEIEFSLLFFLFGSVPHTAQRIDLSTPRNRVRDLSFLFVRRHLDHHFYTVEQQRNGCLFLCDVFFNAR